MPATARFRRVCVLTGDHALPDATKHDQRYGEVDLRYHAAMREALESLSDYDLEFLQDHSLLLDRMRQDPPEAVLNFCDTGFGNVATQELHIPAYLELLGIHYSGAPPACIAICYDKAIVRQVAESLGVAVPRELFLPAEEDGERLLDFAYPALIKPNRADGSVGITADSVVHDAAAAHQYVDRLREEFPGCEVLVQEYLPGPEYGLALIGNPGCGFESFPPLQVDYAQLPAELPPILAYESKTDPDSPYWKNIRIVQAPGGEALRTSLLPSAQRLFGRLQCRDYARFDFRAAADGQIKLMEVNPNPAWDCEAKLACMAGFAGKTYAQMLEMLLEAVQRRLGAA